ncbi:MAG: ATP-dependent Clp protease ATP-binding subunit, partial [Eubacterium sp.]|nr:ATP-dependent Clp protease ATP-binding subunit [Eubacterium sp.]
MYRFNSFTNKANEVLNLAIKSAAEYGHNYVGSEHILIGLLKEGTGIAASVLAEKGITLEDVDSLIKSEIGTGSPTRLSPDDFTPRSKRIIELSFQIARSMTHSFVGTEHILISLVKESDSYAVRFINQLGVDENALLEELAQSLGNGNTDESNGAKQGKKGKSKTPTLEEFGKDLTEMAKQGKIDPVIGREKEIQRVIQILSRRNKNNPCLIGEPGVGKTAIAEGLALKIVSDEVPELLRNKKIVALDLTSMVAGTKYRGDFEERIKKAMEEVRQAKDVILFIDEVHTIIGAGAAEGAVDAANILKPSLARGEIQVIGATTIDEYRKNIEKDAALERRFQPVTVGEPTEEEAIEILKGLRDRYEAHHKVKITDEAIEPRGAARAGRSALVRRPVPLP